MSRRDKPLAWLHGVIKTPPLSARARLEAGYLLRRLQQGDTLPMPRIGQRCQELRVNDDRLKWRLLYRIDPDAIVILDVFAKKTSRTPWHIVEQCQARLKDYDRA